MTAQVAADLRAAADEIRRGDPDATWASNNGPAWWIAYHLRVEQGAEWPEVIAALEAAADAAERKAAYDEGRWCGECVYGVVMDPPCCTQGPVNA